MKLFESKFMRIVRQVNQHQNNAKMNEVFVFILFLLNIILFNKPWTFFTLKEKNKIYGKNKNEMVKSLARMILSIFI